MPPGPPPDRCIHSRSSSASGRRCTGRQRPIGLEVLRHAHRLLRRVRHGLGSWAGAGQLWALRDEPAAQLRRAESVQCLGNGISLSRPRSV
ncbi:hypothetical protein PTTG_09238 [Puccinia triticina 1-1 BBBD Race 1]|uniref:Uncharacterized protein n=1 Tax=Puccinia triticina (isolate 1-1 / race 1 (BBBD)) TaxID=630390 RepID=A0A180G3V6_PUCT1|nr:hypothetical protein PTTG_09238 [Puccinia triticina 1-1 BBBD Race 1]